VINMARVVRIHKTGGPEVLTLEDLEAGAPKPGEIRVRIEAIGINRGEALFRAGYAPAQPKLPCLIGYEAAGFVEVLGEGVQGFAVGERVCVMPTFRQGEYGVYGETAIVPAHSVVQAPPQLSPIQSASVWMQYLTAVGIIEVGRIGLGDYVLITAASSSVGLAAIQLCNWVGATPIAATRYSAKVAALLEQGAKHVVATAESDVGAEVMRITGGKGARVVFDAVGGPHVEKLMNAMAEEGLLLMYGGLGNQTTPYPWPTAFFKGVNMRGWVGTAIWNKPDRLARTKDLILRGLAGGHLRPVISKTFPLDQIAEAHRYLESNEQVGKVVVTV
jgi:NADPH:quinone reductase-like Zn-dependent oxidoreductase